MRLPETSSTREPRALERAVRAPLSPLVRVRTRLRRSTRGLSPRCRADDAHRSARGRVARPCPGATKARSTRLVAAKISRGGQLVPFRCSPGWPSGLGIGEIRRSHWSDLPRGVVCQAAAIYAPRCRPVCTASSARRPVDRLIAPERFPSSRPRPNHPASSNVERARGSITSRI